MSQEESALQVPSHGSYGRLICGTTPTRVGEAWTLSLHRFRVGKADSRCATLTSAGNWDILLKIVVVLTACPSKESVVPLCSCRCRQLQGGMYVDFYGDNTSVYQNETFPVMWVIVWQKGGKNTLSVNWRICTMSCILLNICWIIFCRSYWLCCVVVYFYRQFLYWNVKNIFIRDL